MKFNHLTVDLPTITARNKESGRVYETPDGNFYPSITTVLSIRNKKGLHEWRKRVGDDVANYISRTAAMRGTKIHHMCEDYLNNVSDIWPEKWIEHQKHFLAWCMFQKLSYRLESIDNIRVQEGGLYSDRLNLAGRVDCIAEYDHELSVIDFKTSTKEKKDEWIENYYIQCAAYAEMYEERTGETINQLVVLVVTEDGTVQEFVKEKAEYLPLLEQALNDWSNKNEKKIT
jgi:genome maintenance exonuclease 1